NPEITGSITSSSSSGSRRSASDVNPDTSAKSAVIKRRSYGSVPPASTSLSATGPATKLRSASAMSGSGVVATAELPQWPQNFIPSGFSPPHLVQTQVDISP